MENQNEPIRQSSLPQQSNTNPQIPPVRKSHSFLTNKLFLITLVIAILFTLMYAGIYLNLNSQLNQITKSNPTPTSIPTPSPTPLPTKTSVKEGDPTANWKTYKNAEFGLEVKYPISWYIFEDTYPNTFILLFDNKPISRKDISPHPWHNLWVQINNEHHPNKVFTKTGTIKGDIIGGVEYDRLYILTIDFKGIPAIKSYPESESFAGLEGGPSTGIYFNYLNYGWGIYYPNINYKGEYDPIYDQILSTFKFTNP